MRAGPEHAHPRRPSGTELSIAKPLISAFLRATTCKGGDVVRIGRQHVRNGVATLKNEKGGFTLEVNLPILLVLQATLDAGPCGDLAFICGERGRPLTKESFGNLFKDACKMAGVNAPQQAAHGLRKVAATRAAENGATEFELMAIFGWTDSKMAAHYVKTANRKRLAARAMEKLTGTSIPSPRSPVRAAGGESVMLSIPKFESGAVERN